jgi:hypothetical protein
MSRPLSPVGARYGRVGSSAPNNFVYLRHRSRDRRAAELCLGDRDDENTIMRNTTTIDNVIPRADIVRRAARLGAEIRSIKLSSDLSD